MLNNIYLVGRLVSDPELKETENNKKVSKITLAVPRSYKNEDGIYETDYIDCNLWNGVAQSTCEYCHKGDLVGIKGRIQTNIIEKDNGEKTKITEVIADKVSFLTSKQNVMEKEEDKEMDM